MRKRKNSKKSRVLKAIIKALFKVMTTEWFWMLVIEKGSEIL